MRQLKITTAIMKNPMNALRSENTSCNIDTRNEKVSKMRKKNISLIKNRIIMMIFTIFM